jgi:hypothetical protein
MLITNLKNFMKHFIIFFCKMLTINPMKTVNAEQGYNKRLEIDWVSAFCWLLVDQ